MAAIDMPATPANPSTYTASNGVTYVWDGQKWSATGGGGQTGPGITVSVNPPVGPNEGDLWWNTVDGIMYGWYVDPSQVGAAGEGQWVDTRPGGEGVA